MNPRRNTAELRGRPRRHGSSHEPLPWHPSVFFPKTRQKAEAAIAMAIALSALVHLKLVSMLVGDKSAFAHPEDKPRQKNSELEVLPPTFVMVNPFANQEKVQTDQEGALDQRAAQEELADAKSQQTGPQLEGEDPFYHRIISGRPDAAEATPSPPPQAASIAVATASSTQQAAANTQAATSMAQPQGAQTQAQQGPHSQQQAQRTTAPADENQRPTLAQAQATATITASERPPQAEGLQTAQQPSPRTLTDLPPTPAETPLTEEVRPAYRPPLTEEAIPLPAIEVTQTTPQTQQQPQPVEQQEPTESPPVPEQMTAQDNGETQGEAAASDQAATQTAETASAAQEEISPLPRPQLEPRISAGPLRHQAAAASRTGVVAIDSRLSEFGAYQQRMVEAVSAQWHMLLMNSSAAGSQFGTRVELRFRLNDQGVVSKMEVLYTSASTAATLLCINAVESRSPFGLWHEDMKRVLGSEDTINFTFFYR